MDAILVRAEYATFNAISYDFTNNLTIDVSGKIPGLGSLVVERGYCEVSVIIPSITDYVVRVINTHLETQESPVVQVAQGGEIINYVNSWYPDANPIILIGDFNSGPEVDSTATYTDIMAGITGIIDSWSGGGGETCCYEDDLSSGLLDERIDHIFYINGSVVALDVDGAFITQTDTAEKIVKTNGTAIWPSDHAGRVTGFSSIP
jgi:endonuclease/exonuclease/phosphatase family metal-dependent hydrolase